MVPNVVGYLKSVEALSPHVCGMLNWRTRWPYETLNTLGLDNPEQLVFDDMLRCRPKNEFIPDSTTEKTNMRK
ncbi:hypothetical protein TNCV_1907301 [Trichonephila clavipes]|nr:hypothetical protein TNCV_1907301 [Trichonephila clavipes]